MNEKRLKHMQNCRREWNKNKQRIQWEIKYQKTWRDDPTKAFERVHVKEGSNENVTTKYRIKNQLPAMRERLPRTKQKITFMAAQEPRPLRKKKKKKTQHTNQPESSSSTTTENKTLCTPTKRKKKIPMPNNWKQWSQANLWIGMERSKITPKKLPSSIIMQLLKHHHRT